MSTDVSFSRDEVIRLAELSRIRLTDAEVETLTDQLQVIAQAFSTVREAVDDTVAATSHPLPLVNVLRKDTPGPTLPVEDILAQAPAHSEQMFEVPRIL